MPKKIIIPDAEFFNENTGEFSYVKGQTITIEHSLVSLKKWEEKWHIPFLSSDKTLEQTIDYIKLMTITQNVKPELYTALTPENVKEINEYINDPMTATWFNEEQKKKGKKSGEIITAELIYYWMITLQIPVEFQKWHLNSLLTLIQVCNVKNAPPEKMSKRDVLNRYKSINEARRQQAAANKKR